jgi:hypothetical protein
MEHAALTIFSHAQLLRPVTDANIDDFVAVFCAKLGADVSVQIVHSDDILYTPDCNTGKFIL